MSDFLPGTYNWPSAVRGDTYPGFDSFSITVGGVPPTDDLSRVLIHFRTSPDAAGAPVLSFDSDTAFLSIDGDPGNWTFSIPAFPVTLSPGTYYYDIETTDVNSVVRTYVAGTWTITQDVTRT